MTRRSLFALVAAAFAGRKAKAEKIQRFLAWQADSDLIARLEEFVYHPPKPPVIMMESTAGGAREWLRDNYMYHKAHPLGRMPFSDVSWRRLQ